MPAWRKLPWLVVAYGAFAAAIIWYNAPTVVEGVGAGRAPAWALVDLVAYPDLLVITLLLVPAVLAAVLLPHRPDWHG